MSWKPAATSGGSGERDLIPADAHEAWCFALIDLGTHPRKPVMGKPKDPARQVMIFFEFPDVRKVFKEEHGEQPFVRNLRLNLFFGETSTMYKVLRPWLGDLEAFDFPSMVGMPAQVTIEHQEGNDKKMWDNITGVAKVLPKNIPNMTPLTTKPMIFSIDDNGFDSAEFKALETFMGGWVQKEIMKSLEYQEYIAGPKNEEPEEEAPPFK
jgi:hypothetical protein